MAYSDAFKNEVLIALAINKYDYDKTAEDFGVSGRAIRNWEKKFTKNAIPELLDRAIERMLMRIPENWTAKDWAVALGILLDKYQLLRGEPTQRTETLLRYLESLPDDELEALYDQFKHAAATRTNAD